MCLSYCYCSRPVIQKLGHDYRTDILVGSFFHCIADISKTEKLHQSNQDRKIVLHVKHALCTELRLTVPLGSKALWHNLRGGPPWQKPGRKLAVHTHLSNTVPAEMHSVSGALFCCTRKKKKKKKKQQP